MKQKFFMDSDENMELSDLLQYTARLMGRRHHGHHHTHRRQHAQGKVLTILCTNGPMSQAELLEILDVRSSSLSELLAKLERSGLITRERNEADRRSFIVSATIAAEALVAEQADGGQESTETIFACLAKEEKEELRRLLSKIVTSIKDEPGPGRGRGHEHHHRGHGPGRGRGRGMSGGHGRRR